VPVIKVDCLSSVKDEFMVEGCRSSEETFPWCWLIFLKKDVFLEYWNASLGLEGNSSSDTVGDSYSVSPLASVDFRRMVP
jgi:hypothetical protein